MKSYCISCEKDIEFLIGHLMSDSHKKNQIEYLNRLEKKNC